LETYNAKNYRQIHCPLCVQLCGLIWFANTSRPITYEHSVNSYTEVSKTRYMIIIILLNF